MHWRTRFLINLSKIFVLPPLVVYAGLDFVGIRVPSLAWPAIYVVSVAAYVNIRELYTTWARKRAATAVGARPVPVAKGKLPGNIDLLLRILQAPQKAYVGQRIQEIMDEAGERTINIRPLWTDLTFSSDPMVMKQILATGFGVWEKGFAQREKMDGFFGTGIFNVDGKEWKAHRAMTRPYFSKERISDFETFWKHSQEMFSELRRIAAEPIPVVDVQDILGRFTLDAASEFLFGLSLDTMHRPMPVAGQAKLGVKGSLVEGTFGDFVSAFETAQVVLSKRTVRGVLWPMVEITKDQMAPHMKVIKDYLDPMIDEAKKENLAREKAGISWEGEESLLQELARTVPDTKVVRDELLSILLAGRDTTAALLSFTLYLLAVHPEVEARLREEIARVCTSEPPTYEMVKGSRYLRAVLDETLRLFPPVPMNQRICGVDTTLTTSSTTNPAPLYCPAQTAITYNPLIMQRSEEFWGADAQSFNPERWLDSTKAATWHQNFQFIPFNAGPRICPGQNFAYNEASFFLCVFLPRFRLKLAPQYQPEGSLPLPDWKQTAPGRIKDEKIWPLSSVTIYVKGGLWMEVIPISEA